MTTSKFGEDEVTRCRYVVCLDGKGTHPDGTVHENSLVWGNLGINAFANGDHAVVLGRINQAEAKPGQSPAFILDLAEEADKVAAKTWFDANAGMNAAGNIVIG